MLNYMQSTREIPSTTKTFAWLHIDFHELSLLYYGINRLGKRLRHAKQKRKRLKNTSKKRNTTLAKRIISFITLQQYNVGLV